MRTIKFIPRSFLKNVHHQNYVVGGEITIDINEYRQEGEPMFACDEHFELYSALRPFGAWEVIPKK